MNTERTETTKAFEKYVDAIFIIQNELMFVIPRTTDDRFDVRYGFKLETYSDEQRVWAGMCFELAKKISEELNFEITKAIYNKKMLKLASNFNLDYIETEKEIAKLKEILFSHAKWQYSFENYLNKITENNNLSVLGCLVGLYVQILKKKKDKNPNQNVQDFVRTKWYRYVREAMLEEDGFDIKEYSKYSMKEMCDKLFDLMVECEYYLQNYVEETMLTSNKENVVLEICAIDLNDNYQNFKNSLEEQVLTWLEAEMHKNSHLNND